MMWKKHAGRSRLIWLMAAIPLVASMSCTSEPTEYIETSIVELHLAYEENEITANRDYGNKPLELEGKIVGIHVTDGRFQLTLNGFDQADEPTEATADDPTETTADTPPVAAPVYDYTFMPVYAHFASDDDLLSLSKGDIVTIRGINVGLVDTVLPSVNGIRLEKSSVLAE